MYSQHDARMREMEGPMALDLVVPLAETAPDAMRLGGKGRNLARLVALGYRVPPGFVITTEAFAATIEHLGVRREFEMLNRSMALLDPDYDLGDRISDALVQGELPPEVRMPLNNSLSEQHLWDITNNSLIVRSSATVEDSAAFSFAGIFESLRVDIPDALESTVLEVWSSLFARRALDYTAGSGITDSPRMALVTQAFLDATHSGVMFTTFGGGRTLVEHVEGGCEKLVMGEVIPDRMWLGPGRGAVEGETGELAPKHVESLSVLARDLESHFGGPQDVEWCVYGDALYVLQTRPITATFDGASTDDTTGAILTGVGASSGFGSGKVHRVFNIDQALKLRTGEVLVTPMTNPDMVVAMRNSAAIVTDVGGMICHAAIVSRELGLPCVVGTQVATTTLNQGHTVTVDGTAGAVHDGKVDIEAPIGTLRQAEWADVWEAWSSLPGGNPPLVPSLAALAATPQGITGVVLRPEIDLRADARGLWNDLERMTPEDRSRSVSAYVGRVERAAEAAGLGTVDIVTDRLSDDVAHALAEAALGKSMNVLSVAPEAAPLGAGLTPPTNQADPRMRLSSMHVARDAAKDTLKFFGHQPAVVRSTMPDPAARAGWWESIPEYGRFHRDASTGDAAGDFDWLEVRPELVISALLKSLVQPGFEMVPRVMGFRDTAPLHIKWIRCRYHFRSDLFEEVWKSIVDATWDTEYMADLMHRVRASYDRLAEVLVLFPDDDDEIRSLSGREILALMTAWWPRWTEFFALCWFIQAQGDDILYPFIEETVSANLHALDSAGGDLAWPAAVELILPTTPVMSGQYMASVGALSSALQERGLTTTQASLDALETDDELADLLQGHLEHWHWMRDRDLQFEPWDTPERVIGTALRTDPHAPVDYAENLRLNVMALALHSDLAEVSGRSEALNHAVRFLHDLNVERENHHVLWLKYSYPLRRLFLEVENRLIEAGSLVQGDVWFMQAPELIAAVQDLPDPLTAELVARIQNRRRGYEFEAKFSGEATSSATREDDYY